jgi:hypothetical protein
MARGRIIDREIFSHEILGELSLTCRHLYHGLIVYADDEGRLKCSPKYLKAKIFPYDDISEKDIQNMVDQLATKGFLLVYQVATDVFLEHRKWEKWQPIRKDRFKPSDCPSPVDGQPLVNQRSTTGIPLPNLTKPNQTKPKTTARFEKPTAAQVEAYAKTIGFDLNGNVFIDHYEVSGWMRGKSPIKDWKACVRTWKSRQRENGGNNVNTNSRPGSELDRLLERETRKDGAKKLDHVSGLQGGMDFPKAKPIL